MKLQPYPKYKDSGIQWIGEIPEGWEIERYKIRFRYVKGKIPENLDEINGEGYLPYLSMEYLRGGNEEGILYANDTKSIKVDEGDLLLLWDGSNAGEFILGKNGYLSSTMVKLNVKKFNSNFSWYLCKSFEPLLKDLTIGMGIPHVNGDVLENIRIPIPNNKEQTAIASCLDKKTARINAMIEKDKKLIALLKEKRTALINHAVTKGLDPNVKLKDSGIDWIGEIPDGWEVKKTKHLSINLDGKRIPISADMREEGDIPYYGATGVLDYVKDYLFNETLLLVGEDGAPFFDKTKNVAYSIKGKSWVNNHAHVLRVNKNVEITWLCYYLNAVDYSRYIKGTTRDKLNQDELSNIIVITPPLPEQTAIANFLDRACSKIDRTIRLIEKKIALLEEYKKSLIHHVVTGKVNVTGVKA